MPKSKRLRYVKDGSKNALKFWKVTSANLENGKLFLILATSKFLGFICK